MAKKKKKTEVKADGKKILILTASPVRDKYIDQLIAEHLRKMGHTVWVRPCIREGRQAVLEVEPDVVVVPPIRNPYSRDFVGVLKSWNLGVVSRHTEPSCDWQDFKKMTEQQVKDIMGRWTYVVDKELVWSQDEREILSRRRAPFPVIDVGAFPVDVYKNEEIKATIPSRKVYNQKYKFNSKKKNLLIASPWGFADFAPDLKIDETDEARLDAEGRDKHLAMIKQVAECLSDKFNILVTIHPGVLEEPYKQLGLPLDSKSTMIELLLNNDALIHAGSNAAISSHLLNIPAFQYGDVNVKSSTSWWSVGESPISRVSPYYSDVSKLIADLGKIEVKTNANKKAIRELEKGRYGKMDGKATERAAKEIAKVNGKFVMCWPKSTEDYDQLLIFKNTNRMIDAGFCSVCKSQFFIVKNRWRQELIMALKLPDTLAQQIIAKKNTNCPHCGAKFYYNENSNNPSKTQ